ncbi:MAG TPA: LamG-like jellyroll fold domain-containing protein, partial [Tepidisphaeraceae bacterium]|nr:LamG-like jellyroll fold domain-containing protein [Tepidisphaeraceae bacterium]
WIFLKGASQSTTAFGFGLTQYGQYGQSIVLMGGGVAYLTPIIVPTGGAYVACVFSPSTADIYVNGQDKLQLHYNIGADSSGDWAIGANVPDGSNSNFTGTIDDVAVYNYGLTADQIMRHYMIGLGYSVPS